jgi:hypothetical protein
MVYQSEIQRALGEGQPVVDIVGRLRSEQLFEIFTCYPELFNTLAKADRTAIQQRLRFSTPSWPDKYYCSGFATKTFKDSIGLAIDDSLHAVKVHLAAAFSTVDLDPRAPSLTETLTSDKRSSTKVILEDHFRLWVALRRLERCKYGDTLERSSLERLIIEIVDASPGLWAASLHLILQDSKLDKEFTVTLTISLAMKSPEVESVLRELAELAENLSLREQAREIQALSESADQPREELVQILLNTVVRWTNSRMIFPHPLSFNSRTWLSSHTVEEEIRAGLKNGLELFRQDFIEQGGKNERALVQSLLSCIRAQFRSTRPFLRAVAKTIGVRPAVALDHRTLVDREEKVHGPDIAFLMRIHGAAFAIELAEFVQVKKPKPGRDGSWIDSWTIEKEQLGHLLETSYTAVYWLISGSGQVLTVPAKYLRAHASTKRGKTFSFRLNDARSVAVPVDEFFIELLLGTWLGNPDARALDIARGRDRHLKPAHVLEIDVHVDRANEE